MGTTATDDRSRARAVLVCVVLVLAALGSITSASAYWPGRGVGSGAAVSATPVPVTLSPAVAVAQLYPGGQAAVSLSANNPNAAPLRIVTLALDTSQGSGGFAVDGAHVSCDLSSLSFAPQTNGGAGWTLPASGSLSLTLPSSLSMGNGADSACQAAQFTVYLKATP